MAKKKKAQSKKQNDNKLFAFLASFLTIIGFIIALFVRRDNKYVMFYAKHGLVLFIVQLIAGAVEAIPFIGSFFLGPIIWIIFIILWIITWVNALSGKMKDTWLISEFANKIKL